MRGAPVPTPGRLVVSCLVFLSAMSVLLTTSDILLSVLLKFSLGRRQTFPPGRSWRIAVLCFMQTSPQGRSLHSPCCVDRLRSPQGLAASQCPAKLPEPDRGADFYLNLNSSFRRAFIAFYFFFEFNPPESQLCSVGPSSKTHDSRAFGPWLAHRTLRRSAFSLRMRNQGLAKSNNQPRSTGQLVKALD